MEVTKGHIPVGTSDMEKILIDLDLLVLGSGRAEYLEYSQRVRAEVKFLPNFLYRRLRSSFLKKFLRREKIFLTKTMAHLGGAARQNISTEISNLAGKN